MNTQELLDSHGLVAKDGKHGCIDVFNKKTKKKVFTLSAVELAQNHGPFNMDLLIKSKIAEIK